MSPIPDLETQSDSLAPVDAQVDGFRRLLPITVVGGGKIAAAGGGPVEGVLEKNREKIYHAILLDPNTASVCSTTQIYDMVEEMFEAEAKWIPKF